MRCSGILMHISSLPGPYGIGTMGAQAYKFVDFLKASGQHLWQTLPLTPTGYGDSPYQSCSAFAGNHYLIDLDLLIEEGLLEQSDLEGIRWCNRDEKVDFGLLYNHRLEILRRAYIRAAKCADLRREIQCFARENESWLQDYALFMALKDRNGGKPWYHWEDGVKFRRKDAMIMAILEEQEAINFYCFVQFLFFRQWNALHAYANGQGVKIIGDVPIYVPLDSVEVWSNPELFELDERLDPVSVAGCPPDGFTAEGQLWGNPLYRWDVHEEQGYSWWLTRMAAAGTMYDMVRVDHFRGFEAYWAVPFGDKTARNGKWVKGPGISFVKALKNGLPELNLIAEDLGFLTQDVLDLRNASGWPGMKVLQFAFDPKEPSNYLPHTYVHNSVCYTGTHDNMTMRQWFDTAAEEEITCAVDYMALTAQEGYVWGAIRVALASVSDICIIQMQDYLELGAEARMNFPGTQSDSNWTWRVKDGIINEDLAKKIRKLSGIYGRI